VFFFWDFLGGYECVVAEQQDVDVGDTGLSARLIDWEDLDSGAMSLRGEVLLL